MTFAEFTQNPVRATQLAESGDVLVMQDGMPTYRVSKTGPNVDILGIPDDHPLAELVRSGLVTPPQNLNRGRPKEYPVVNLGSEVDSTTLLLADRNRLGY